MSTSITIISQASKDPGASVVGEEIVHQVRVQQQRKGYTAENLLADMDVNEISLVNLGGEVVHELRLAHHTASQYLQTFPEPKKESGIIQEF